MDKPVKPELTGWRDEGLSRRHRLWGFDCPAVDIDFLVIEYDLAQPIALIEYKKWQRQFSSYRDSNYQALKNLADRARIPFFIVFYADDYSEFSIFPSNHRAETILNDIVCLSETNYVHFLYEKLRKREMPENIKAKLG